VKRKFKYYWVVNPVKSEIEKFSVSGFTVFNSENVVSGKTELEAEGKIFFDLFRQRVNLNSSLWIFADDCFETQDKAEYFSRVLCVIAEAVYDFKVSRPGLMIIDQETDECNTKQPPQLESFDSVRINEIGESELQRLFDICRAVISLDAESGRYFESIFDYLRDIRLSPRFVGELALWSFLEHHWAENKAKTDVSNSLKTFLELVFDNREERREFRKAIESIGEDLGSEYNERKLRNILAHGKHFTLSEKWTDENWSNFYEVHEKIYLLVVKGIEIEIGNKIQQGVEIGR
jgi:hypothetical protein